jgi:NAD(P)-dependent dehydrogenase (short-subunit alcohol dehydrogenase family)
MHSALDMGLQGKAVLVTGGAGDIGQVIVKTFARQGARVVLADLDRERAEEVARELDAFGVAACHLDLTCEESVRKAVCFTQETCGRIDILVNVAGLVCRKSFFETS